MASNARQRVALVTGGGRGIGRAISLGLAADGADVAVNYRKDEAAALETVREIEALGRRAVAYQASIDSLEDDERMVAAVLADFGHVDILVNNAGIASRGQSVAKTDPGEVERLLASHAVGPHHLCRLVLPVDARAAAGRHRVHLLDRHRQLRRPAARPTAWARPPWRRWPGRSPRRSSGTAST